MVIWVKMVITDKEWFFGRQMNPPTPKATEDKEVISMKLAIIEAIGLAAMFIIAAVVSYNSGSVGGRVDGEAERSSAIWSTGRGIGLAAKERDGREAPSSKLDGTGDEGAK